MTGSTLHRPLCRSLLVILLVTTGLRTLPARAEPPPHLGYGMMLAWPGNLDHVTAAGFDWFKYYLYWSDAQPIEGGPYNWTTVDGLLQDAADHGLNLLLRVERPPPWARAWEDEWAPVRRDRMTAWRGFFQALAAHIRDWQESQGATFRVALEIWNEPNLDFQWGERPVDPAWYTEMVQYAYDGVQAGNPHVIVVAGGLAPTGGLAGGQAMNDVEYLEAMYDAGLAGHFDVLSTHNYGYGGQPEDEAWGSGILNFRRAEDIRAVMLAHGDGGRQVWATEFGWLLDAAEEGHLECVAAWEASGFAWQRVSSAQQADYLVRAFQYADANWPWMGVMIVSNLDFSTVPWYATCDPLRWFSVLRPDSSARLAYGALQVMDKRYRSWAVLGMAVQPSVLVQLADVDEPGLITRRVVVRSTGPGTWDSWSVITATSSLTFTVVPTTGIPSQAFRVHIDTTGYPLGTYAGVAIVSASNPAVPESPLAVPVTLLVVTDVYRVHLPVVMREW